MTCSLLQIKKLSPVIKITLKSFTIVLILGEKITILKYYPKLAEDVYPHSKLHVFKKSDTVRSEELAEAFDLSKETERKVNYFRIFERDYLFIPFYVTLDTEATDHKHFSDERSRVINRVLFDGAERNINILRNYRTNEELEKLYRKVIEIRDSPIKQLDYRHFSIFQQGDPYERGAHPHKVQAVVDLKPSRNPVDTLKTIWELYFMGEDDFGIDGTVLAPRIPSGPDGRNYYMFMLEVTPYERGHSAHRIMTTFGGEISRSS